MFKEIITAIQSYIRAHRFIVKNKLWKWIWIPGIIYCILFIVSMYFFGKTANAFIDWIMTVTGITKWLDETRSGIFGFLVTLSGIVLWIIQMLFYFSLFKYIWLIVGSPVFAYLSEKTDTILHGKTDSFNKAKWLKDILRGISIALRNALWQTVYLIGIFLLSLIPVAGIFTILLALLVECYYYGFSMLDYTCERKNWSASKSVDYIANHKGLAIGNGLIFYLMQLVPVLGWVLAPSYAVVAATLSMQSDQKKLATI
ncbi:MAG: EI24 domain-containing protein [Bacteroidetes bacterium]|nr:EI24 domain-containing protein [Bacteroidota bacterium]